MNEVSAYLYPRIVHYHGVATVDQFDLKLFSTNADGSSSRGLQEIADVARSCIGDLTSAGLSDEFDYHKRGFLLSHFGRRGLTVLLCHFGVWTDMPEVFHTSWYRYGDTGELERLDHREPVACYHDLPLVTAELLSWRAAVTANATKNSVDWTSAYAMYFAGPASHS